LHCRDNSVIGALHVNSPFDVIQSNFVRTASLLQGLRDRWRVYDVYLSALLIFAASRLVVVLGVQFGTLLVRDADPGKWDAGKAWYFRLLRWDSGWYATIVDSGYSYSSVPTDETPTVFYPVYPVVSYFIKSLFDIETGIAILLVANVAALIAVLLMTKFVKDELGDEAALLTLAFFCFFPTSLFLSAGYTEPLFLAFALASLILLKQERYVLAAALAGLSLGTRSTGIVLTVVILWELWWRTTLPWPRLLAKMALCSVLSLSGLLAFMAYLGIEFGHPMAFSTNQAAWHSGTFLDRFVSAVTLQPFQHFELATTGWFLVFLALVIWSFWHFRPAVWLYALGTLMLPYFTLGITDSMNRFVLLCFPAFMGLAVLCRARPWLACILVGVSAALLFRNTALFSQWHWVG
jgi:Mannosyltransferase (PIG-V)